MKKSFILFIIIFFAGDNLTAAFDDHDISARAIGIGKALSTVSDTAEAVYYNPAGMINAEKIALSASYVDLSSLGLLHYGYIGLVYPIDKISAAGIAFKLFSSTSDVKTIDYSEKSVYLDYALKFGDIISTGMSFRYMMATHSISGKGAGAALNLGTVFYIDDNFRASLVLENIIRPVIRWYTGAHDTQPLDLIIGLSARMEKFLFLTELSQIIVEDDSLQLGLGVEYQLLSFMNLRFSGFNQYGSSWSFVPGLSLFWQNYYMNYSYQFHYTLPGTHYISVDLKF